MRWFFLLLLLTLLYSCKEDEKPPPKPQTRKELLQQLKMTRAELMKFFGPVEGATDKLSGVWKATEESLRKSMMGTYQKKTAKTKRLPDAILLQRIKETHIYMRFAARKNLQFRTFLYSGLSKAVKGEWRPEPKKGRGRYTMILIDKETQDTKFVNVIELTLRGNKLYYKGKQGKLVFEKEVREPKKLMGYYWQRQEQFVPVIEY